MFEANILQNDSIVFDENLIDCFYREKESLKSKYL